MIGKDEPPLRSIENIDLRNTNNHPMLL
jgi:hypothetical protein